jgi:transcriptional regulator with XRE-family HTH domain
MGMFINLGKTLSLVRELRGRSQAWVAREAGVGKSQLSKYENGKELPKLDSLEKVLKALGVGYFEFFYTLYLVDQRAADLVRGDGGEALTAAAPRLLRGSSDLTPVTDQAFSRVFNELLTLYRTVFEQIVLTSRPGDLKAPS